MTGLKLIDPLNRKIGQRLKEIRELRGLTQVELSRRMKITRTTLTNMEAGRQNFAVYNLAAFAKVYKIPIVSLFAFLLKGKS